MTKAAMFGILKESLYTYNCVDCCWTGRVGEREEEECVGSKDKHRSRGIVTYRNSFAICSSLGNGNFRMICLRCYCSYEF